jgi:hypothetical protein
MLQGVDDHAASVRSHPLECKGQDYWDPWRGGRVHKNS